MFIVYRAIGRDEYWKLRRARDPAAAPNAWCDADGLAPGEDPRRALTITGEGWPRDDGQADITFPAVPMGTTLITVVASRRGPPWPKALGPGEWRPFTG